jgi:hypothetical protein
MQKRSEGRCDCCGTHGEKLRFGWTIAEIDPTNPQSRALVGNSRGAAPPNFVAISRSADPATAFKAAFAQLAQKARKQPPVIKSARHTFAGGANEFMFGDIDFTDGEGK